MHIFQALTQEEWKTVFAIVFLESFDEYRGTYTYDDYATPGLEGETDNVDEVWRRVVRFLALEHGFTFEGLSDFQPNGSFKGRMVCPENALYLDILRLGKLPPGVPLALETAERVLAERAPSLTVQPMQEARYEISQAARERLGTVDPKDLAEGEDVIDRALAALGIERRPITVN